MGLENLKSAFSNIKSFDKTPQHGAPGDQHIATHSNLDKISVTDFIDSPILGLTLKFNELYQSQLVPGGSSNFDDMIKPTTAWNIDGTYQGPVNFQNLTFGGFSLSPTQIPEGFTKHFDSISKSQFVPGGSSNFDDMVKPYTTWNIDGVYQGPVNFFNNNPPLDSIGGFTRDFETLNQSQLWPSPHTPNEFKNPTIMTNLLGQIGSTVDYQNLQFGGFSLSPSQIPSGFTKNFTNKEDTQLEIPTNFGTGLSSVISLLEMRSGYNSNSPFASSVFGTTSDPIGLFAGDGSPPSKQYDTKYYDFRIPHNSEATVYGGQFSNINPYMGTKFDDGIGGRFNPVTSTSDMENKYFASFGIINKPKGFLDADPTTDDNYLYGSDSYNLFNTSKGIKPGIYGNDGTGKKGWYFEGPDVAVPNLGSPLLEAKGLLLDKIGAQGHSKQTRTINVSLSDLKADTLEDTKGWGSLYNKDHTSISNAGYHYGTNVNRGNLNIRYQVGHIGGTFRDSLIVKDGAEPYVISEIEDEFNRKWASRSFAGMRPVKDFERLGKFLTSPKGLLFFALQNLIPALSEVVHAEYDKDGNGILWRENQLSKNPRARGYQPFSTTLISSLRLTGAQPNVLATRTYPFENLFSSKELKYEKYIKVTRKHFAIHDSFNDADPNDKQSFFPPPPSLFGGKKLIPIPPTGDHFTTHDIKDSPDDGVEDQKHGMPFYFKDMRNGKYVFFRAYLEGLNENVSPTWSEENYIGRSEPVYVYERATRDVNFTFNVFAFTKSELSKIYEKLQYLTSMCYPQYKKDENFGDKERMKPPIIKLRIGELYGKNGNELAGHITALTYTWPDNAVWETKNGERVPKLCQVNITFRPMHSSVPSLGFNEDKTNEGFFGYKGE